MIDTKELQVILCLACHNPVPQKHGKRARLYCNDVCKTSYHRQKAREAQQTVLMEGYSPELQQILADVQAHSMELAQRVASALTGVAEDCFYENQNRIAELEAENRKLREQLNQQHVPAHLPKKSALPSTTVVEVPPGGLPASAKRTKKATLPIDPLPPGFVDWRRFANDHRIAHNAVSEGFTSGSIKKYVKGKWQTEEGDLVTQALDRQGQRDFWVQFHRDKGFEKCDMCPHLLPS